MPSKNVDLIIQRLSALEATVSSLYKQTEAHLIDGGNVRTDIDWLKKAFWALFGSFLTAFGSMAVYIVTHIK